MNTYIALFRGINVGGNNILPMKDLVRILEGIGLDRVKTYIQSGNVICQSKKIDKEKMAQKISTTILQECGFSPKVLLLDISVLQDAIDNNPFTTTDGKALHFFFLETRPIKPDLERLRALKSKSEQFKLGINVFYLYTPDGIGRSKLAANVEKGLGVSVTARNWNTVSKLIAMANQ